MEEFTLKMYPHPDYLERNKLFTEKYDLIRVITNDDPEFSKRNATAKGGKVCRFCKKDSGQTTFSNLSHVVSKLIGNQKLYSAYECDECNKKFGFLESDLANYLGVSRSITGITDEKLAPGFVGRKLSAKSRSFIGNHILIIAPEDITRDPENAGKMWIKYVKNRFTPNSVYRALLKSSVSVFNDSDFANFHQATIRYLDNQLHIKSGALLCGYKCSFHMNLPLLILIFKKRDERDALPTFVVSFYFSNNMLSLPLPFYKPDLTFVKEPMGFPVPPPYLFNESMIMNSQPTSFTRDMSSIEVVDNEEEHLTFQIDPEFYRNAWAYDPVKDVTEHRQYNPAEAKYLIMTREGASFDPKELSTFIKEHIEKEKNK